MLAVAAIHRKNFIKPHVLAACIKINNLIFFNYYYYFACLLVNLFTLLIIQK